jgi:hypothetical protein
MSQACLFSTARTRVVRAYTARTVAAILLIGCGGGTADAPGAPIEPPASTPPPAPAPPVEVPSRPFVIGQPITNSRQWIEYTPGDAPLVIVAPHGGLLLPAELLDRGCAECVTVNDANTQALARAIADSFAVRTGRRPHVVANLLHRRKFDGNRDRGEATSGNAEALAPSWEWMHAALDSAKADVVRRAGRGLLIDLHGHAHAIARLELGYLLGAAQLRQSDAQLGAARALGQSSIARLADDARGAPAPGELLRGTSSLGGLLEARGIPVVPGPTAAAPLVGEDYFSGGYNTDRHGSRRGGLVDAVQIECHMPGIRDTPEHRARFAGILTDALLVLLRERYGWTP